MSESAPKGYYVYQPFGSVSHPDRGRSGRLYGVGGLPFETRCDGLTKEEATAVAAALNELMSQPAGVSRPQDGKQP